MTSSIFKFGRSKTAIGGGDIWDGGGPYPFPKMAKETTISSTSVDDSFVGDGITKVQVIGLDQDYRLFSEVASINGLEPIPLNKYYLRIFRAKAIEAGPAHVNIGDIQIKHDDTVIAQISAGLGQTLMAVYTIPADYVQAVWLSWLNSTATPGSAVLALQVRPLGEAWQTQNVMGISGNGGPIQYQFARATVPGIGLGEDAFPARADIRVRCLSVSGTGLFRRNMDITSGFELELED